MPSIMKLKYVGQTVPRVDALDKTTRQAELPGDLLIPVTDPMAALAPNAPLVHPEPRTPTPTALTAPGALADCKYWRSRRPPWLPSTMLPESS
jgi:hypothetical protein